MSIHFGDIKQFKITPPSYCPYPKATANLATEFSGNGDLMLQDTFSKINYELQGQDFETEKCWTVIFKIPKLGATGDYLHVPVCIDYTNSKKVELRLLETGDFDGSQCKSKPIPRFILGAVSGKMPKTFTTNSLNAPGKDGKIQFDEWMINFETGVSVIEILKDAQGAFRKYLRQKNNQVTINATENTENNPDLSAKTHEQLITLNQVLSGQLRESTQQLEAAHREILTLKKRLATQLAIIKDKSTQNRTLSVQVAALKATSEKPET